MEWFWIALAIGLLVVEISTTQLVSVWLALSALIVSVLRLIFSGLGIGWQMLIFGILSLVLLALTRPLVKKILANRDEKQATNLELVIGKEAIVVEDINNIRGEGAVKINGLVWSARSVDGTQIPAETIVIFKEIDGNKAMVEKKGE
ncbi:MAG: NfeD family protein [Clostridia bacterium]|nr:NfeD family protein [Clostridia bacterium]